MLLGQLIKLLCISPKECGDHKLLSAEVKRIAELQDNKLCVTLAHQELILPNPMKNNAQRIRELDYEAMSIFSQATLEYFNRRDLNDVSNFLSKRLNCAVYLINHDHTVLTSTNRKLLDILFPKTDFDSLLCKIARLQDSDRHFLVREIDQMTTNIHWLANQYHQIGEIVVINHPTPNQDLINLVASYFARYTTRMVLAHVLVPRASRINYSQSMELALTEHTLHSPVLKNDLSDFLMVQKPKYIFTIGIKRQVNEIFMRNLLVQLNNIFSSGIYCYRGNNIILLVALQVPFAQNSEIIDQLKSLIDNNHIPIGVSNPFRNIAEFFDAYHQAETAMNNARVGLVQYADFSSQILADSLRIQHRGDLINPDIIFLKNYDREHGTDYFQTLKTYLLSNFSASQTAKIMNVHHNTVLYRLNKAQQLIGYRFDSLQKNKSIFLSLILADNR